MFSDAKDLKLCEEEKIELDLYRGIYLHPTDSGIETDDDSGVHFIDVKYDFRNGILPKDFFRLTFERDSLVRFGRLVEKASSGDSVAQDKVKYICHEASREILKEISEKSGYASWYFLAVGCPEGTGLFGGISTAADVALIIDDVFQGLKANSSGDTEKGSEHLKQAKDDFIILTVVKFGGKVIKETNKYIGKKIVITVGKNGKDYPLDRNMIKEKEAWLKLIIKDFANGYFGTEVAPAVFEEMIDKSLNKLYKYLDEKGEDDDAEKKEE